MIGGNYDKLDRFTFSGLTTKAKVVDVYDGDTITIVFYFHDLPIKDSFRMNGYDSPEIKPLKSIGDRDLHINAGKLVKKYLIDRLMGKLVWVKFCQEDKYGRLLGDIYTINPNCGDHINGDEEHINQTMISLGYGKEYHGGHKNLFTQIELREIVNKVTSLSTK